MKGERRLKKLVWADGAGGGAIRHGDTDQHMLVLIGEAGATDQLEEAAADYFEPQFTKDASGKSFKTLREKHFHRYGSNALVIGLDADGFTKRTERALDECADKHTV